MIRARAWVGGRQARQIRSALRGMTLAELLGGLVAVVSIFVTPWIALALLVGLGLVTP